MMRLFDAVLNSVVLGDAAAGVQHLNFGMLRFQTAEEGPPHVAHEGGVTKTLHPLLLEDNFSSVIRLMTDGKAFGGKRKYFQ